MEAFNEVPIEQVAPEPAGFVRPAGAAHAVQPSSRPIKLITPPKKPRPAPATPDLLEPTIFHESWWLDAASGGSWSQVEVECGGTVVARLPFQLERRRGFLRCQMPHLTHMLGPAFNISGGSESRQQVRRMELIRELVGKLPRFDHFKQIMHRGITDVIGFQAEGFETSAQFTYEIPPTPEKQIWLGMRDKTRNVIRRAEERASIETIGPEEFFQAYRANLETKHDQSVFDLGFAQHLAEAALEKGRGRIVGVRSAAGLEAAVFCVWDKVATYYLMSTRTNESASGMISLLVWEAIRHSAANERIFDFHGLAYEGAIRLYSSFGGLVRPRYIVIRRALPFRIMQGLASLTRKASPFC